MINKAISLLLFFFLYACNSIEFVLTDYDNPNPIKEKVKISVIDNEQDLLLRELSSFLGNNEKYEYILEAALFEEKQKRSVKQNQVAEKIDYTLIVDYRLYYVKESCIILDEKIETKFSFTPKSFGYNFGSNRSLEKLYSYSIKRNIKKFIDLIPINNSCIK